MCERARARVCTRQQLFVQVGRNGDSTFRLLGRTNKQNKAKTNTNQQQNKTKHKKQQQIHIHSAHVKSPNGLFAPCYGSVSVCAASNVFSRRVSEVTPARGRARPASGKTSLQRKTSVPDDKTLAVVRYRLHRELSHSRSGLGTLLT